MGFDEQQRQQLGDAGLRAAFGAAVAHYEVTRREIDGLLDELRVEQRLNPLDAIAPQAARDLLTRVPPHLRARELQQRSSMQAFTGLQWLRVGDVLSLPTHVPHALQHGVRVVEFQTPAFERRILYFTQKVLTQPNWDTAAAIAIMDLNAPAPMVRNTPPQPDTTESSVESIVEFPDFKVLRVHLPGPAHAAAPGSARWQPPMTDYALCMCIDGEISIGQGHFGREQACLVPNIATALPVQNSGRVDAVLLWAIPT